MGENRPVRRLHYVLYLIAGWLGFAAAILPMVWFGLFLAGIGVPKGIDDGRPTRFAAALAIDLALLAGFAVVHSLMARRPIKQQLALLWPQPLERALYSLIAGAQIALLCALWRPLPELVWSVSGELARGITWCLFGGGWWVVLAALAALGGPGRSELFGLAQARAGAEGRPFLSAPLVARGIYRHIRHPLYAGTILALWAAPDMSRGRLLLASVFTLYLVIGLRFEERDLERERGESFRAYRDAVPGWLPRTSKGLRPR